MKPNNPRHHHVVPQFFLRNFSCDKSGNKLSSVAKSGNLAVWMERSIKEIGCEQDFYVHDTAGRPVSVESDIGRRVETPLSQSETWRKISTGQNDSIDRSDRGTLYALVRHLEARTPHYLESGRELEQMAADPASAIPFTAEERSTYQYYRNNPAVAKRLFNLRLITAFEKRAAERAYIVVMRSRIPFRTSTTPVICVSAPAHPALALPLPGMVPFQRLLVLNPATCVAVIDGDFDGHFSNIEIDEEAAMGINRHFFGHFSFFRHVRHLVSGREGLLKDFTWGPYELVSDSARKMVFRRNDGG